jgi:hypothetical protein
MEALESKALLSHAGAAAIHHHVHDARLAVARLRARTEIPAGVVVMLTASQGTYALGQTVSMTLTVTNVSHHPVTIFTGPSIDGFIVSNHGMVVWRSNSGAPPHFIVKRTLRPGHSFSISAQFTPTAAGIYTVYNQMDPSATATFDVVLHLPAPPISPPVTAPPPPSPPVLGGGGGHQPPPISPPVTMPPQPVGPISPIVVNPGSGHGGSGLEQP